MKQLFLTLAIALVGYCSYAQTNIFPLSGYTGIGTTSPANQLQIGSVGGTGYSGNAIAIGDGTNVVALHYGATGYLVANGNLAIGGNTNYTNQLFLASGGNVGMGTASPSSKVAIAGGDLQVENGQGRFKGWYNAGSGRAVEVGISSSVGYIYNYDRTAFSEGDLQIGGVTAGGMTVKATTGNVGIGTTSPSYKFQVNTGTNQNIQVRPYTFGSSGIFINAANDANTVSIPLEFGASSFSFNIGNVGIGTTSPNANLSFGSLTNIADPTIATGAGTIIALNDNAVNAYGIGVSALRNSKYDMWYQTGASNGGGYRWYIGTSEMMTMDYQGNIGIGTTSIPSAYKLAVNGAAIATSMTVKLYADWPDYVFKKNYHLLALSEVKTYIDKNQHLPNMPSEAEVAKNGINLGEIVKVQTKKIEELTLYLIEKDKQVGQLQDEVKQLKTEQGDRIAALEAALSKITNNTNK